MTEAEMGAIVTLVAENPTIGARMAGTGGCRKVRLAKPGGGRSGGYRVVTFYTGPNIPVFLLTVFGKNEKANLTKAEQMSLAKLTKELVGRYSGER